MLKGRFDHLEFQRLWVLDLQIRQLSILHCQTPIAFFPDLLLLTCIFLFKNLWLSRYHKKVASFLRLFHRITVQICPPYKRVKLYLH
jgi:hypothetical protein